VTVIASLDYLLFDQFKQYSDVATVITYDPRNRGRSVRVDEATATMQQEVKDLEAVRRHFKVEKFVPVGFSYGGKMVVMYAAAYPDRVARVIQLGPLANNVEDASTQRVVEKDFGASAEDVKRLDELRTAGALEKSPREFCEALSNVFRFFLVGNPANASRLSGHTCELENEWPLNFNRWIGVLWPTALQPLTAEELKKVAMPVLTIHGTKDRNAPYEGGRAWAAALPDARLVTLEGAAHAMWADDPVAVIASIRHFLRGEWPLGSRRP
jgi:proline iminopeptidase